MLLELLQKGYGKAMGLNCAEKMLYGANWAYNLQLPPQALKIASGFGGGMGAGAACGVVTGACMVEHAVCKTQRQGRRHQNPRTVQRIY